MKRQKTEYEKKLLQQQGQLNDFRNFIKFKSRGTRVLKYLGNDLAGTREWIEGNFMVGMTWENYGSVWVVDHIVPFRMFNLFDENDLKICWHYKNLMPIFDEDNLKKQGNAFFSFELLHELKDKDIFFKKLYERVKPEVEWMLKYIEKYHEKFKPKK
jgi:hypothetical protein